MLPRMVGHSPSTHWSGRRPLPLPLITCFGACAILSASHVACLEVFSSVHRPSNWLTFAGIRQRSTAPPPLRHVRGSLLEQRQSVALAPAPPPARRSRATIQELRGVPLSRLYIRPGRRIFARHPGHVRRDPISRQDNPLTDGLLSSMSTGAHPWPGPRPWPAVAAVHNRRRRCGTDYQASCPERRVQNLFQAPRQESHPCRQVEICFGLHPPGRRYEACDPVPE